MVWAETYRGSGRFTGRRAAEPVRDNRGYLAPGWTFIGDMSNDEFEAEFEAGEHDQCHSPSRPDDSCLHCARWAGDRAGGRRGGGLAGGSLEGAGGPVGEPGSPAPLRGEAGRCSGWGW